MKCVAQTMNWGMEVRLRRCERGGDPVRSMIQCIWAAANVLFSTVSYYYGTSILYTAHPPQYTFAGYNMRLLPNCLLLITRCP